MRLLSIQAQPWVYPEALGAFHLLLAGEGRDEGGLNTIVLFRRPTPWQPYI